MPKGRRGFKIVGRNFLLLIKAYIHRRRTLGAKAHKMSKDYADVDSQATKEMLNKIRLNESYVGLGFPTIRSMNELLGAFIGILSAITLTISLFTSKVPQESPLAVLNQPLFFVMM